MISVTSSQLANLISQAAHNRQIQDRQLQNRQLQESQGKHQHSTQQPLSPTAFRYDESRMTDPMALTLQINERERQQFQGGQNQQLSNRQIYLPSLQHQMKTTLQQQAANYDRHMGTNYSQQE